MLQVTFCCGYTRGCGPAVKALLLPPYRTVPDSLYYQCNTHQKLGWKVEVYNAGGLHL